MAEIIGWPKHKWSHCTDPECRGCHLCHGGLSVCSVCGGAEGSLPTDCPGERMFPLLQDEVYDGRIDYRRGQGWVQGVTAYGKSSLFDFAKSGGPKGDPNEPA